MSGQPDLAAAPEGIAAQPAKAGGKGDRVQAHVREQHPRENDPDADMPQCTEERQHHPAGAAVIAGEGVAGKTERIKQCYEPQVGNGSRKGSALVRPRIRVMA